MQIGTTYVLTALAAVMWGANFNLSKHVLVDLSALAAGAARFDIAALAMLAICAVKGQRVPLIRHGRSYATLGLVGIAGFNVLFFYGMQTTSAVNAALIMALNPLMTALMAFMVGGHRPDLRQLIAFPIGAAGVGVVVLGGGAHFRIADDRPGQRRARLPAADVAGWQRTGVPVLERGDRPPGRVQNRRVPEPGAGQLDGDLCIRGSAPDLGATDRRGDRDRSGQSGHAGPGSARPRACSSERAHCSAGSTAKSALLKRPRGRLTARFLRPEP